MGFYLERYSPIGAFENRVYDGVVAALDLLAAHGARLFVATSKNEIDALPHPRTFRARRRASNRSTARAPTARARPSAS